MPSLTKCRGHILVVDDYEPIRNIVRALLEQQGFRVSEAANGADATIKASAISPDLILLDLALPGVNGAELAKTLHQKLPSVPIVVLTMYEGIAEKMLGSSLAAFGISDVISKSTGLNSLVERVEKVLFPQQAAQVVRADASKSGDVNNVDKKNGFSRTPDNIVH